MKPFILLLAIISFAACSSDNDIPGDIIGIDKMKVIMWDMIRAGEMAQNNFTTDTAKMAKRSKELFLQVFAIHNITKDEFYNSYHYYEAHPDKNKILLDSVSNYSNRKRMDMFNKLQ